MKNQLIQEIQAYIRAENIENASKRLVDLTWYYHRNENFHSKSIDLRKNYNESKLLGHQVSGESKDLLLQSCEALLAEIPMMDEANSDSGQLGKPLIEINGLAKKFHHGRSFQFGPIDMQINKGDIVGIVGENGNGKTTYLKLLIEEIAKDAGEMVHHYHLHDIEAPEIYKRKNRVAYVPQRIPKWRGTLKENLVYYAASHGVSAEENDAYVEYVIHRMGLTTFIDLKWSQLSSGYKLRFELAKMLVWQPEILVLDEPLANLDIQATQNLLSDLKFLAESHIHPIAIILTSQQLHEVEQISNKVLFLRNGAPVFAGSQSDFIASRAYKVVEFSVKNDANKAMELLKDWADQIDPIHEIIKVKFNEEKTSTELLQILIENQLEISYFRDISDSTIQLFNE